jgi:nucleoid DNA-binding protein
MTKAEFVESLANTLNQTKSESERVLEAVVDVLKQALQRGEKMDLRGLGVFKVRETKLAKRAIRVPAKPYRFQQGRPRSLSPEGTLPSLEHVGGRA